MICFSPIGKVLDIWSLLCVVNNLEEKRGKFVCVFWHMIRFSPMGEVLEIWSLLIRFHSCMKLSEGHSLNSLYVCTYPTIPDLWLRDPSCPPDYEGKFRLNARSVVVIVSQFTHGLWLSKQSRYCRPCGNLRPRKG